MNADVEKMIAKMEEAAKLLHPILLGTDAAASKAAHDALNCLSVARIQADFLLLDA